MNSSNQHLDRDDQGAILMLLLVLVVAIGALAVGFLAIAEAYSRSGATSFNNERAAFAAESGLSYYVARLALDPDYLVAEPAPHPPSRLGSSTFQLETATPGSDDDQWIVVCAGQDEARTFRVHAVIGPYSVRIPEGILVAGTGDSSAVAFDILGNSSVRQYDPLTGEFDINVVGDAVINVNGSLRILSSSIHADVTLSGVVSGDSDSIQGSVTENALDTPVDKVDSIVRDLDRESRLQNDNGLLASGWGENYTHGPDGSGSFIASGGTYLLPSGTYRLDSLRISDHATVVFDTSGGPTTLFCLDELRVDQSSVLIDPGTSASGLLLLLGPGCTAEIDRGSVFGGLDAGSHDASYSRILGPTTTSGARAIRIDRDSTIYGHLHAAGHELTLAGSSSWYGSGILKAATLDSGRFFLAAPSESSASIESEGDYRVLAKWEWQSGPGTELLGVRARLQALVDQLSPLIATLLAPVLALIDDALGELLQTPPDNAAAVLGLTSAQATLQPLVDAAIIDPVEGQAIVDSLAQISGAL